MATDNQIETFSFVYRETGDLGAAIDAVTSRRPPARACSPFLRMVCECLDVSPARLLSADRSAGIAADRHVAMWVVRQATGASYPELGLAMGGKHHTSVMHAIGRVAGDHTLKNLADEIEAKMLKDAA